LTLHRTSLLLAAVLALAAARSAAFVLWPPLHFDADQAVIGLMAKHLLEGRAFPVFQYAQSYVLVVESWLAAPVFAVAGATVPALKAVPAAMNLAVVGLLFGALRRSGAGPGVAALATLPVAVPGVITTGDLTDALGMNIESLLFALLIWWVRHRGIALGVVAATGLLVREFTVYALAALAVVEVARTHGRLPWRRYAVAAVAFGLVWSVVSLARQYSSPLGPGTSWDMVPADASNVGVAASFICIEPAAIPGDLETLVRYTLPVMYGVGSERLSAAGLNSRLAQGWPWLWPVIAALVAGGVATGARRVWRSGWAPDLAVGTFLVLVGTQAAVVYALTRCGHLSVSVHRYALLALFLPAGAIVLALSNAGARVTRARLAAVGAVVIGWATVCAIDHARLWHEWVVRPPVAEHRSLTEYLLANRIHHVRTDYWTGYEIAFLSGERIVPLTGFERVLEYGLAVEAHRDGAVEIRRVRDERCPGATTIADWYVCPPTPSVPAP
jgi:hypothetical protein